MKLILLTSAILLLSSCDQYRYDVTYEKCNGMTGSVVYTSGWTPSLIGRDRRLQAGNVINNVCDFSYTRTPITK